MQELYIGDSTYFLYITINNGKFGISRESNNFILYLQNLYLSS